MSLYYIEEVENLYGRHSFAGARIVEDTGEGAKIMFVLDDKTYVAEEDPDDGYRSYLGAVYETDEKIEQMFEPVDVVICGCCERPDCKTICSDGIQILDAKSGHTILRLATDYLDDYYPVCRMEYSPENMWCNQEK